MARAPGEPEGVGPPHPSRDDGLIRHDVTALELVWRSVWVRAVVYVILAVLIIWLLVVTRRGYVFALQVGIIGFVIAYILNPVVEGMRRLRFPRPLAVVIVYTALVLLLVLGSVLITQVVSETGRFINLLPEAFNSIASWSTQIGAWFSGINERLPGFLSDRFGLDPTNDQLAEQVREQLANVLAQAATALTDFLENLVTDGPGFLLSGATTIISTTLQFFLILLASAYFLYDFPKFTENIRRYVPVRWRPLYSDLSVKADHAVGGYLRGQLLITSILGGLIWLGLSLIGVPLALAISFLAAIFNLVPYLGPIIGVIPAVLLGFTVSPLTALLAVVVFIVANQLEGNFLSPMILSRSVNLHPVTVLLAIMVGLGLLGFVGALLAVPTAALIKLVLEEYLLRRPAYRPTPEAVGSIPDPSAAAPVEGAGVVTKTPRTEAPKTEIPKTETPGTE